MNFDGLTNKELDAIVSVIHTLKAARVDLENKKLARNPIAEVFGNAVLLCKILAFVSLPSKRTEMGMFLEEFGQTYIDISELVEHADSTKYYLNHSRYNDFKKQFFSNKSTFLVSKAFYKVHKHTDFWRKCYKLYFNIHCNAKHMVKLINKYTWNCIFTSINEIMSFDPFGSDAAAPGLRDPSGEYWCPLPKPKGNPTLELLVKTINKCEYLLIFYTHYSADKIFNPCQILPRIKHRWDDSDNESENEVFDYDSANSDYRFNGTSSENGGDITAWHDDDWEGFVERYVGDPDEPELLPFPRHNITLPDMETNIIITGIAMYVQQRTEWTDNRQFYALFKTFILSNIDYFIYDVYRFLKYAKRQGEVCWEHDRRYIQMRGLVGLSDSRSFTTPPHLKLWDSKRKFIHAIAYHGVQTFDEGEEIRMYPGYLLEKFLELDFVDTIHLDRIYDLTEIVLDKRMISVFKLKPRKFCYAVRKYKIPITPNDMNCIRDIGSLETLKLLHELKCQLCIDLSVVTDVNIVKWMLDEKFICINMLKEWCRRSENRKNAPKAGRRSTASNTSNTARSQLIRAPVFVKLPVRMNRLPTVVIN